MLAFLWHAVLYASVLVFVIGAVFEILFGAVVPEAPREPEEGPSLRASDPSW